MIKFKPTLLGSRSRRVVGEHAAAAPGRLCWLASLTAGACCLVAYQAGTICCQLSVEQRRNGRFPGGVSGVSRGGHKSCPGTPIRRRQQLESHDGSRSLE